MQPASAVTLYWYCPRNGRRGAIEIEEITTTAKIIQQLRGAHSTKDRDCFFDPAELTLTTKDERGFILVD
ncbi:MAG TPA: hypothetical protein VLE47_00505 [Candidatus Saccharimonadales bacterium]|nr:hypothetical protein [Candidatus Saccharimonadales bacterium]